MRKSRAFGRALSIERQISLATLDFEYHVAATSIDTDKVFAEVMKRTSVLSTNRAPSSRPRLGT